MKSIISKKTAPKVLVFSGYGLNCEEETKFAFDLAGADADIVHINDLIDGIKKIKNYQILAFPGGFSYGDDLGSGKAYANKVRNHLGDDLSDFIKKDKLVIGICNGFQIITNLGMLPGALTFNNGARYIDRWVDLKIEKTASEKSPWLYGIETMSVPVAHGEGKYIADKKEVAIKYFKGEICKYQELEHNPNGSPDDIAGVMANEGRILGLMPHPERALFATQLPHFTYLKEKSRREGKRMSETGPGFKIFQNAIKYFH